MIRRVLFGVGIFLMVVACQKSYSVAEPDQLIEKQEMIHIITDMMILDAASNVSDIPLLKNDVKAYRFIADKYNVDSIQLKQNLTYYNTRFDENLEIYEQVKKRIEVKRNVMDSILSRADSLKTKQ
ncbi:MAG: DUF4296 domain-containing protein [Psychroflexus sp.]|nr:DUF4296 domain-containing protein [Psychroflexus sp.]MDN6309070.1 DUF4296 domain-containing protein [Psychroflexus sp.]